MYVLVAWPVWLEGWSICDLAQLVDYGCGFGFWCWGEKRGGQWVLIGFWCGWCGSRPPRLVVAGEVKGRLRSEFYEFFVDGGP